MFLSQIKLCCQDFENVGVEKLTSDCCQQECVGLLSGTPCTRSMCKVGDRTWRNEERSELGNNELPKYLFSDRELE